MASCDLLPILFLGCYIQHSLRETISSTSILHPSLLYIALHLEHVPTAALCGKRSKSISAYSMEFCTIGSEPKRVVARVCR